MIFDAFALLEWWHFVLRWVAIAAATGLVVIAVWLVVVSFYRK